VAGATGLPHAFMGGIASTALGRPRWTHDVDLLVRPRDARAMLRAFADAGFATEETDQAWLYKASRDGVLVDVIFESTGGIVLDDEMLARVRPARFDGLRLSVLAPEDLLVIKAIVHREHRQRHWFDALALVESGELDWEYLLRRAAPNPRRVASLLLYAQTDGLAVPDWVVEELLAKAREQEGTGAEPDEYLVAHAHDALVRDPRTAELELDVAVDGGVVVLSGVVATPERQAAVGEVVAQALPDREVRNLTGVDGPTAAPFVETLP
jgi:predicted nucleotidyltransferase